MALLTRASSHPNVTDPIPCGTNSTMEPELPQPHAYYALCYCILILAIIFGNVLVCLAVLRERALQTTTNYLVVSLAVADLLVATLVMPWMVYLEVTGGVWTFSRICCDIFVTMDVMMCTASILNLCAISIDRYTAVVKPVQYQYSTGQSSCRRVSLMIVIVWMLAFAVSCPLLFGFNTTGDPSVCSISNPSFIIYSSLVSFYLPFMVTLLLYVRIYLVLRQRQRKRSLTRQGSPSASTKPCYAHQAQKLRLNPFQTSRMSIFPGCQGTFSPCLSLQCTGQEMPTERRLLSTFSLQRYRSFCHEASPTKAPGTTQNSGWEERRRSTKPAVEVRRLSNGGTVSSLRLAQQQPRLIQLRERKATQMLAIVLGAFIVCWLPFFLIHILNAHCPSCHVPPGLYSASTWLGYVNSALNPIIYTTFNTDFRKAFLKILCC
ncbi:DRD3 protein, partial [Cisticola juncidis]|nr:DRD3 protein [Cisticola juncidis]